MERCSALDTIYSFESTEEDASEEKPENEKISRNEIEEPSPHISGNSVDQTIVPKQVQIQVKSEHGQVEWSDEDMPDSICGVLIKDETEDVKDDITDHSKFKHYIRSSLRHLPEGICNKLWFKAAHKICT